MYQQGIPRAHAQRSIRRSGNVACNLVYDYTTQHMSPLQQASMIEDTTIVGPITTRTTEQNVVLAGVSIPAGSTYFLFSSSKYIGWHYVAYVNAAGEWKCSAKDRDLAARCIRTIAQHAGIPVTSQLQSVNQIRSVMCI